MAVLLRLGAVFVPPQDTRALVTDSRAPDGRILIDVLGYQRWVEGPKAAVPSLSRGREGQIMQLPAHMDMALKRKKELENSGIEP